MNAGAVAKQKSHVADALDKGRALPDRRQDASGRAAVLRADRARRRSRRRPRSCARRPSARWRRSRRSTARTKWSQRANATEYGLVAYLHTNDPRRIYRVSRALQYGMVAVNRTKVTGAPIPFGGMKQSGIGREGARLGMEAFTEVKYVCRDWR